MNELEERQSVIEIQDLMNANMEENAMTALRMVWYDGYLKGKEQK